MNSTTGRTGTNSAGLGDTEAFSVLRHVFLRVHAPLGPLPSSGPIAKLVRRALDRAGIAAPSRGAHVLRHSAATALLRQGASLDVIGAVLRHRSVESTAHYAKVDVALLRSIVQPWPVDGAASC